MDEPAKTSPSEIVAATLMQNVWSDALSKKGSVLSLKPNLVELPYLESDQQKEGPRRKVEQHISLHNKC